MAVENASYLNQLDETFPGSGESKTQGDDHLRLIKRVLKATFPAIAGAVTLTHTQLNALGGSGFIDVLKAKLSNAAGNAVVLQSDIDFGGKQTSNLGSPTQDAHATTKKYVDDKVNAVVSGGGGITMGQVYPVGSVYLSMVNTNPATLFGVGTWAQMGFGRVLVGEGTTTDANGEQRTFAVNTSGGNYRHALTAGENGKHGHPWTTTGASSPTSGATGGFVTSDTNAFTNSANVNSADTGDGRQIGGSGNGDLHNNIQPYLVVFMWKRTA